MKNLVSLVIALVLSTSLNAQNIMAVGEIEVKSPKAFKAAVDNWMSALKKGTGKEELNSYFYRVQGSNTIYWVQWHKSMEDLVAMQRLQEANEEKIYAALMEQNLDEEVFAQFNALTKFRELSIWEYVPELSTAHESFAPLPEEEKDRLNFRRVQYFSTDMNSNDAFEANRKKANEMDKEMGNEFHYALFRSVFGKRNADYLVMIADESKIEYHKHLEQRMTKRLNNDNWKKRWEENSKKETRQWGAINDESWVGINEMKY